MGVPLATVTTVGVTAVVIVTAPLAGRYGLVLQSDKANTASIYLGGSAVTADSTATGGLELLPGESQPWGLPAAATLYAIAGAASQKLRVVELS